MNKEEKTIIEIIKINNNHGYCDKDNVNYLLNLIDKLQKKLNKKNIVIKLLAERWIEEDDLRCFKCKFRDSDCNIEDKYGCMTRIEKYFEEKAENLLAYGNIINEGDEND